MESVRISHPDLLLFSEWQAPGRTEDNSGRILAWQSPEWDTPTLVSCIGIFEGQVAFNAIQIETHPEHRNFFPGTFRFEVSADGLVWEPILKESDFKPGLSNTMSWNFALTTTKYIKFLFLADATNSSGKYFSAFGAFRLMISGLVDLEVSSELDRLWVRENLIDGRPEYGWSSSLRSQKREEFIQMDLGAVNRVSEIRLLSKNDRETFFPEVFRITYSEDNIAWHNLFEENGFLAEPGTWYRWRFIPTNVRYLRLIILEGARTREGKYISQLIEIELYAAPDLFETRQQTEPVPYASVLRSGIVRLAMDGEVREGIVVQGSDRRLRDATTEMKGIVELARDGEDRPEVAVQGSDRRLKYASEDLPGIVRLARNNESRRAHALQSDDDRLKAATEESRGIVELAADGEDRPGVVVQGHDRRLRPASESSHGIVRLSHDGADKPGDVVQANDSRLRKATTEQAGIMRFARLLETENEAAVQSSDPRLMPATEERAGIVELAANGEDRAGVVVQGHDRRLKLASEEAPGIVELAPPGSTLAGRAVQAQDPRLTDARPPLSHEHDYAPVEHEFSSHTGLLLLKAETGKTYEGIHPPPFDHSPIHGVNEGAAGVVGQGAQGVLGYGEKSGISGLSHSGEGISGASLKGPGGRLFSGQDFALVAGAHSEWQGIATSGRAILALGLSAFQGTVECSGDHRQASLGAYFFIENQEILEEGDILVASSRDGWLARSRSRNAAVMGIFQPSVSLLLNARKEGEETRPVALYGLVPVKVTAESGAIKPGDLLVTAIHTGTAEKWTADRPLNPFARSMGSLAKGQGVIAALLL
ncbi:MAG: discoidin domain-containing protein [Spirochaetales bacterium]|nr:discoidin domain-containing protein [Spirochaetales bacterium]